ncbi:MAG: GNAT family N-acetyltransferase, partial [Clostridia bacterium]|nr:GNAT family N-acetyltransferase [Clostridia bacterium]
EKIWTEHYTPIIGAKQVSFMLDKFQSAKKIESDCKDNGFLYLMPYYQEVLAGYAAVKVINNTLFLSKFYIHKDFRGLKIATYLFEHIKKIAKSNQCRTIWLTVNKNNMTSIAVYMHFGFHIIDELVTDIGHGFVMDDYKMSINV